MSYPEVKLIAKNAENAIIKRIPLPKEYIIFIGTASMSAIRGRVDTKAIQKINTKVLGGNCRPDVFYDLRNRVFGVSINIQWIF